MASSSKTPSSTRTAKGKPGPMVRQFSVFLENKCGRLLDFIRLFEKTNIHILGLSVIDTTDSAVVRMVVDDPDKADEVFHQNLIPFSHTELLVVEMPRGADGLTKLLTSLLQAEINIYYTYGLIVRPKDRPLLAFHVEDNDLAADILTRNGYTLLLQTDLSR